MPNGLMGLWHHLALLLLVSGHAACGRQWRTPGQRCGESGVSLAPHGRLLKQQSASCPRMDASAFNLSTAFVVLGKAEQASLPGVLATCLGLGRCQYQAGGVAACSARTQARSVAAAPDGRQCAAGARKALACGGAVVSPALAQAAQRGQCEEDASGRAALCLGVLLQRELYTAIRAGNCTERCTAGADVPLVAFAGATSCTIVQLSFPAARCAALGGISSCQAVVCRTAARYADSTEVLQSFRRHTYVTHPCSHTLSACNELQPAPCPQEWVHCARRLAYMSWPCGKIYCVFTILGFLCCSFLEAYKWKQQLEAPVFDKLNACLAPLALTIATIGSTGQA